ncbi:MAG: hypothetical protein IJB70_03800 [Clostridia bacterium]|nr:hypothetical protein [Clostridia bacterium]
MFLRNILKKLWGFCILGFVAGVFVAFVMPPVVIAIIEGVLLGVLCVAVYCCK